MQDPAASEYDFLFAEFQRDGEQVIREGVATRKYTDPRKLGLAQIWLEEKDRARDAVRQKLLRLEIAERRRTALSASNAAWAAAIAAIIAAICAAIAILLSDPVRKILLGQ
jgi:hypothetical protein